MSTITCKAAVAFAPKEPVKVVDIQVEPPRKGEVRVKVIANALCHTDIYTLSGCDPEGLFPVILGHEATAVVESVGEGVSDFKPGDLVVPCYTPQCKAWDCIWCNSNKTNLCAAIRATQGKGMMPDGTSRLKTMDGQMIHHFMGCSTFAEYAVLAAISCAKINPESNPFTSCVLGCGIPTGWGAVYNNPNFHAGGSVAVWGLGAVGLAVIQAAKAKGAARIYAIDLNEEKFPVAKEFGATHFINPKMENFRQHMLEHEKWGYNFTYDCTGVIPVMRDALELSHRGFGESMIIGVAAAGQEISTRPFQFITGRTLKGTAFGGWKSLDDVPKLSDKILLNEMPIDKYVTHEFDGIEKIQELIDALHSGKCLRGVLKIGKYELKAKPDIETLKTEKTFGGYIKQVRHWSESNQCQMKFSIFMPEDEVPKMRCDKFPVIYHLSGLTCDHTNAKDKSGFARAAAQHKVAIVFPDTSPRDVEVPKVDNWRIGFGAGHYCNATSAEYKKHFNMYTYITEELPAVVEKYFHIDNNRKSIMGHSMGGNGALNIAARNPNMYRSVSAFAPICNSSRDESEFCGAAMKAYFGDNKDEAKKYDCSESMMNAERMPKGLVDCGTHDFFLKDLGNQYAIDAIGKRGHNIKFRMQEGYDHYFAFVASFIDEHIAFHAMHINSC